MHDLIHALQVLKPHQGIHLVFISFAGGPVFNEIGQCVGIAFQSMAGSDAENIGYVIPTPVINHFLTDYKCAALSHL
jgi:hypothetical protein